jgi:TatD DNase family protein
MGLIDTHTHLDSFSRKGVLPEILNRSREAGLDSLITIGTAPDDWSLYNGISRANPGFVHYSVGLHPCSVEERWSEAVAQIEAFWDTPCVPVALGETGLDRFHLPADAESADRIFRWQRASFASHLEIACDLGCPLVVHSRGAFQECIEMIDASGYDWSKVVFHCFSEGPIEMEELLRRGAYGSFTGIITYKSAENVRQAARKQGLERLMIETDAPYLTPVPHRGKPNEPAYLKHTAEYAAGIFGISLDRFAELTSATAREFYGLSQP